MPIIWCILGAGFCTICVYVFWYFDVIGRLRRSQKGYDRTQKGYTKEE